MIDCGKHLATHPKTLEAVIRALEVPDKKHNPNAVNELSSWFERISFFQDFMHNPELDENVENIIKKFSQCIQISREPAGKILLKSGETMKRMYVVISGKVGVYVNLNEEFISPEQAAENERIRLARLNNPEENTPNYNNQLNMKDNSQKHGNTNEDCEEDQEQDIDGISNEVPQESQITTINTNNTTTSPNKPLKTSQQLFQQMDVLCSGQHFGNLDLLYDHKSNCQIQTIEDCVLGYLEERFYFTYIKQFDEFRLHLLMLPLAKSFPVSSKNQIRMFFVNFFLLPFNKHQIVFAEHTKPNGFFLVKEGLFLSYQSRSISEINAILNKDERQQLIQSQIAPSARKSNIFGDTPSTVISSSQQQQQPILSSSPSQLHSNPNQAQLSSRISRHIIKTNQHDKKKIISLFSFAAGQIFGEDDLVKMRRRRYSLKCDSLDGLVYFMRKRDYQQLIYENAEIKYQFLSLANGKIKQLQHRMEQIKGNIDLMKAFAWEDRNKSIDDSQSSMIYLDMNNKPKSKLDLNEYLENQAEKANRKVGGGVKRSASQLIGMTNGSSVEHVSSNNNNTNTNSGNARGSIINNGNQINTSQNNISKNNHMLTSQNSCVSLSTPFRGNSPASTRLTPISPLKARCSSIQSTIMLNLNLPNVNNNNNNNNDSLSNSPLRDRNSIQNNQNIFINNNNTNNNDNLSNSLFRNRNSIQNNQNIFNNNPSSPESSHNFPESSTNGNNNPYGFSALLTLPQQQQQQQNQSSQTNFPSLKSFPHEFPPLLQLQSAAGNPSSTTNNNNNNNNTTSTSSNATANQPTLQHFQSSSPSSPLRQKHLNSQQRLSEPSLLLSQIPLLNLEKLSQDRLLSYSPVKSRRTYSNYPSSQESSEQIDLPYSILNTIGKTRTNSKYIDDESNFCTTRQRIYKPPELLQLPKPVAPTNTQDLRKSTRDISSMVDSLVQSQKNLNYDGTLNYFLNFKNETNQRALNKQTINSHTFKFMHDLLHSERYKNKKDKVPVFSKNQQRNKGEEYDQQQPATERNQFEQQQALSQSQAPLSSQSLPQQQYLQSEQRLSSMRINTHSDLSKEPSYDSSPAKFHLSPLKQTKYSDISQRQSFQQAYQQQQQQGNMLNGFIPSEPWTILQKPLRKQAQQQQLTHRRVTSNKLSIHEEPMKQAEI